MHRNVLLVDDSPDTVKVLARYLEGRGYAVLAATDPERGLELAHRDVGLVLLDLQMPGIDGLEFCRRLRNEPGTARIPVIFLSAIDLPEARIEARRAGGREYLVKPVPESILLDAMTRHFAMPPRDVRQVLDELGLHNETKGP